MPAAPTTTSEFLELIRNSGIYNAESYAAQVPASSELPETPEAAAAELVKRNVISRFQSQLMLQGKYKGFRLGSYVIREVLGRGGMGAVYLAEHQDLRRKVAIKVLVSGKDADQKLTLDRFLREARAAAALDHPNIVRIHDVARHGETPYLVMEYVDGENLQHKLDRDGAMPYPDAVECIAQAAAGLQHAHEKGFVHRDIKPANLIKDSTGTIKILDMGLARSFEKTEDKLTEIMDKGAIVGTADFISPEQALNNPVDIRADIYSLGATFFALVSGKPPFDGNTTQKLLQHQLKTPPTLTSLNHNLPAGLAAVIGKMLSKKREMRHAIPADVIAALHPWLPASHRVLAGLSRTRLAENADIQVALQQEASHGGSSLRLSTVVIAEEPNTDSNNLNSTATTDTADGIRAAATSRTSLSQLHRRSEPAAAKPKSRKKPLIIAGVAAVAVVLGIGFAVLTNGKESAAKSVAASVPGEQAVPPPAPPAPEPPAPTPPIPAHEPPEPPPAPTEPKLIHRFDAAAVKPFKVSFTGTKITEGERPKLPDGVSVLTTQSKNEADITVEPIDGSPVFTIINHVGPASGAVVFDLQRAVPGFRYTPGNIYRVTVDYRADGTAKPSVAAQTISGRSILPSSSFASTKGDWKTAHYDFRAGLDPLRIAFDNKSIGFNSCVYLRSLEVAEVPADPSVPPSTEPLTVLNLDLKDMKAFSQLAEISAAEGSSKTSRPVLKSGDGKVPTGWSGKAVGVGTQIEYLYDEQKAGMGLRNIGGPGGASFTSPPFNTATGVCRVRFEYQSSAAPGMARARLRPMDGGARDIIVLEKTADWKSFDAVVPMLASSAGIIEFYNADPQADGIIHFRGVNVTELPASAGSPRVEGQKLYALDLSVTPNFHNKKEGYKRIDGPIERLSKGVKLQAGKLGGLVEFSCEVIDGGPVLTLVNNSDEAAASLVFDVEITGGAKLLVGKDYLVRMVYQARKAGEGTFTVGSIDSSTTTILTRRLGPAEEKWTTLDVGFTKQETPIKISVTHRGPTGTENALIVKSFELIELK